MTPRSTPLVESPFYYKSQGITPNGSPIQFGGPVKAECAQDALKWVIETSASWNVSVIMSIAVYVVDEYGVVSEDPEIVHSGPFEDRPLYLPHTPTKEAETAESSHHVSESVQPTSVYEVFSSAEWCREIERSTNFPTVRLNGGQNT